MSSPAYDGKGQPPVAQGWFSGLTAWWNRLTPQYVSHTFGGVKAPPHSGISSTVGAIGAPGTPPGAPGKAVDSSGGRPATSGIDPSTAQGAAKP